MLKSWTGSQNFCTYPHIMNKSLTQKKAARACAVSAVLAVFLMPLQVSLEGRTVSVQMQSGVNGILAPSPKPVNHDEPKGFFAGLWDALGFSNDNDGSARYTALSSRDARIYAQIFAAQDKGDISGAKALISNISDKRLMGHVLAQRYLATDYKASYGELKSWMAQYASLPQAQKIYALASSRGSALGLKTPQEQYSLASMREPTMQKAKTAEGSAKERLVISQDKNKALESARMMYNGQSAKALTLALSAANRSAQAAPQAGWVAGLIYWKKGDYENAAKYFSIAGSSEYASSWQASAGAYWAGRAYKQMGNRMAARKFNVMAARHTHTFYGLLASHDLNQKPKLSWDKPNFTRAREAMLQKTTAGQRAFALVAAGQYSMAEEELLNLDYQSQPELKEASMAYAAHIGLPSVAMRLAGYLMKDNGDHYDSALYPVSPWDPEGGYTVDPALVHAVMRQESRFNTKALSQSGASGLMQLMPSTASYIAQKQGYGDDVTHTHPEMNVRLGQDYLSYLLENSAVKGDVVSMLVAYNAGPGNLRKWQEKSGDNTDMLLFIETIPVKETREYVKRVMTNYWIYRDRAGQPLNTLADLSAGKPAQYANEVSTGSYQLAAANQ